MTELNLKKTLRQNAFCWAGVIVAPPIVMVVLDLFDRHTPTSVATCSSMVLILLFGISHGLLGKNLNSANESETAS